MHTPRHKEHHRKQIALAGAFAILALLAVIGNLCWENTLLRKQLEGKKPQDPSANVAATSTGSEALLIKDLDILLKYPAAWGEAKLEKTVGRTGSAGYIQFSNLKTSVLEDQGMYRSRDFTVDGDNPYMPYAYQAPQQAPKTCIDVTKNTKRENCQLKQIGVITTVSFYDPDLQAFLGWIYTGYPKYPVLEIFSDSLNMNLKDLQSVLNSVQ